MLTKSQQEALKRVPGISRPIVTAAYESRVRASKAIAAYCLLCAKGEAQAIKHCEDDTCPLLFHRPFQNLKESNKCL